MIEGGPEAGECDVDAVLRVVSGQFSMISYFKNPDSLLKNVDFVTKTVQWVVGVNRDVCREYDERKRPTTSNRPTTTIPDCLGAFLSGMLCVSQAHGIPVMGHAYGDFPTIPEFAIETCDQNVEFTPDSLDFCGEIQESRGEIRQA